MARLAIPVQGLTLYATGDVMLSIWMELLLRDDAGGWSKHKFRVDSGTDISTFPAHEAKKLGLQFTARPAAVTHQQPNLPVRSGQLAFQVVGLSTKLYTVPCFFLGDPNNPPPPGTPKGWLARKLLQPLHLLNLLKFSADKGPMAISDPHGEIIIEET